MLNPTTLQVRRLAILAAEAAREEALRHYYRDPTDVSAIYALTRATLRLYRAEMAATETAP